MWGCFDLIGKYWFVVRSDTIIDVIWTLSLLKVTFFAITLSGNIFWNTFGRLSHDLNEKLASTFFNVQMISAFITLLSSYTKLSIVLLHDCTVSSTVLCSLLALSLDCFQFWLGAILHVLNVLLSFHMTHQSSFSHIWQSKSVFWMAANSTLCKFWTIIFY